MANRLLVTTRCNERKIEPLSDPEAQRPDLAGALGSVLPSFVAWAVGTVGSSRSSALIRIGLGFLIWARFASEQLPFRYELGWHTAFSLLFFLATAMMIAGVFSRLSTLVAGVLTFSLYYYFGLVLGVAPYTHHHTYWLGIATILCSLTPCGKSFSVDRWLAVRQARASGQPPPTEAGNLWGLRLIVIQLTMMYFWSAYNKSHAGFLDGDRLEALFMHYYIGSNLADWAAWAWAFAVAAWVVLILEYALALGMPFSRTRKYLVIPGLVLHAAFYVMLPIATYSATIVLLYLAYFDADKIHRVIDELGGWAIDRDSASH